jgi:hypothetical protein
VLSLIAGVALLIWNERRRADQKLDDRLAKLQPTPPTLQEQIDSRAVVSEGATIDLPTHLLEESLYVAEVNVSANRLDNEHWLEIAVRVFNATLHPLKVVSVSGYVDVALLAGTTLPDEGKFNLPTPSLLSDRSNIHDIPHLTEVMVVLQQLAPPDRVKQMQHALSGDGIHFYFDNLHIDFASLQDGTVITRLFIPGGVFLRQRSGLFSGRVTRAKLESTMVTVG